MNLSILKITCILIFITLTTTKEVIYNLNITLGIPTPNCFGSSQVLINGISPGPVIRATEDDLLIININNYLPKDEFTMHYHGLHQKGTPYYDGVPYLTQLPIPPNKSYQHRIQLHKQIGSYLYHSHTKTHALTALGALIIDPKDKEPFEYDDELILLLSDNLFTSNTNDKLNINNTLNSPSGLLINGLPMLPVKDKLISSECKPLVYYVQPNKKYKIRIISGTTKEYISFSIAGHILQVVEVEGFYVKPIQLDKIPIHSGQRYSLIIDTNVNNYESFNIHAHSLSHDVRDAPLVALAKLKYEHAITNERNNINNNNNNNNTLRLGDIQPYLEHYDKRKLNLYNNKLLFDLDWPMDFRIYGNLLKASSDLFTPLVIEELPKPTQKYYFRITHEEREEEDMPRWYVNGTTLKLPEVNLLKEAYKNNSHAFDNTNYQLIHLDKDEVIQITIQNTVDLSGVCDNHPWHLHGHSFWDLGSGKGTYNINDDVMFNKQPILRDTFTFSLNLPIINLQPKEDCGWHTILFKSDNPGLWLFHCHILKHMDFGMIVYFLEGDKFLPPLPNDLILF